MHALMSWILWIWSPLGPPGPTEGAEPPVCGTVDQSEGGWSLVELEGRIVEVAAALPEGGRVCQVASGYSWVNTSADRRRPVEFRPLPSCFDLSTDAGCSPGR